MVSNPACLGDGCSEEMDLGPLIMKFPAVPELIMAISQFRPLRGSTGRAWPNDDQVHFIF